VSGLRRTGIEESGPQRRRGPGAAARASPPGHNRNRLLYWSHSGHNRNRLLLIPQ